MANEIVMNYPRTNYEMTDRDLAELLEACKPVAYMVVGGHAPSSPQENANRAWAALGKKMGFDGDSVVPRDGMGMRHFTAIPTETPEAKAERDQLMAIEAKKANIARLEQEVEDAKRRLTEALA